MDAGELNGLAQGPVEFGLEVGAVPTECRYCQTAILSESNCPRCDRRATVNCVNGHGKMGVAILPNGANEAEIDVCSTCSGIWLDGHECHLTVPIKKQKKQELVSWEPSYWQNYDVGSERSNALLSIFDEDFFEFGASYRIGKPEPLQIIVMAVFGLGALYLLKTFVIPMLTF